MERVLLLNQSYEPISIIGWQKAISMLVLDKIEVIREYNDKYIHSRHIALKMPSVIRLLKSFKRPYRKVKFNKTNILARDHFTCQYCNQKFPTNELTYDHIIPKSRGGKTVWKNITTSCSVCNSKKGNHLPHEVGMKLHKQPTIPDWVPIFTAKVLQKQIPEIWKDFFYIE